MLYALPAENLPFRKGYIILSVKSKEGFNIKLDTNGTNPDLLRKLIDEKLINYVAMDIKAPLAKYSLVAQTPWL